MGRGAETEAYGAEWGPKATGCLAACEVPPKPKRTVFKLQVCAVEQDWCRTSVQVSREWCEVREEAVVGPRASPAGQTLQQSPGVTAQQTELIRQRLARSNEQIELLQNKQEFKKLCIRYGISAAPAENNWIVVFP